MIATGKLEDGKWSEKMVEGNDDLRTIECLRGRLLAERQASKVANEDAETMGNKLIELENQLKEETKSRNKAERKLRFLKKKLESLNISFPLDESEQSSSSDICAHSCKSSTSTSGLKDTEVSDQSKPQITTPKTSENLDNSLSETISSNQSHENSSTPENSSSSDTANSNINDPPHELSSQNASPDSEDSKTDDHGPTSKKAAIGAENESHDKEDYVDNSLALVPLTFPVVKSQTNEVKISSGSVREALEALRLARKMIQGSMARQHMIRVGHS